MSCKGCDRKTDFSLADVEVLVQGQLALESDLVDDLTYRHRIDKCFQCPSLTHQTTCSHCGCFVQFRAWLAYKKCPNPSGSNWEL
ncbi:hypothetical protein ACFQ4N_14240 [Oceanobacillus iheyensis]|uniref:hypothetical protein n=1 Tax=Oceanobacillus iheyensis TaxID=182710 RepID=UPI003645A709